MSNRHSAPAFTGVMGQNDSESRGEIQKNNTGCRIRVRHDISVLVPPCQARGRPRIEYGVNLSGSGMTFDMFNCRSNISLLDGLSMYKAVGLRNYTEEERAVSEIYTLVDPS